MLQSTSVLGASLRYRRPYWMMFLQNKDVDNWRIYTVINQPEHQLIEQLHQSWLGGLDRPYTRPKCMAHQPLWLEKKRHNLKKARLDHTETSLERYVLEWHQKFHSFKGTLRPQPDDLVTAFDLVERPLDLSYACQLLSECRNEFNIRLEKECFQVFLEACLRVDRRDVAEYALENAEELGFWFVDANCRKFVEKSQTWYKKSALDGLYYPLEDNEVANSTAKPGKSIDGEVPAAASNAAGGADEDLEDELAKLNAELEELERMEREGK